MDAYEGLRELLDKHPAGCPPAPEIIEILKILFTPEEAKVALGLGFRPFPVKAVARRAGVKAEEAVKRLESLADKGMVFYKEREGEKQYALVPIMPGVFEFPFMKGERNPTIDRLAALWQKYLSKACKEFGSKSMPFSRIIPVGEEVASEQGTLPYEKVYEMIDRAKVVGVAHCACRSAMRKCDNPTESCMMFDDTCTFLVERGYGRYLTKDEMKQMLKKFDDLGLVRQVNNAQDKLTFICNCCTCCCGLLRAMTHHGNPNVLSNSGFVPKLDRKACTGCGICVEKRCPMKALTMKKDRPVLDPKRCIGCGLCVTGCPEQAFKMVRSKRAKEVAPTNRDMAMKILEEKGKLKAFLPYLDPDVDPAKK
ncbi:MAG: 4Fe-4S dicluster domain-containing protein [bacterium]|nr:4Fe-4S dicluster domain-containing protein [bacterium]